MDGILSFRDRKTRCSSGDNIGILRGAVGFAIEWCIARRGAIRIARRDATLYLG